MVKYAGVVKNLVDAMVDNVSGWWPFSLLCSLHAPAAYRSPAAGRSPTAHPLPPSPLLQTQGPFPVVKEMREASQVAEVSVRVPCCRRQMLPPSGRLWHRPGPFLPHPALALPARQYKDDIAESWDVLRDMIAPDATLGSRGAARDGRQSLDHDHYHKVGRHRRVRPSFPARGVRVQS